jgi:signal transduction histidine kinase
VGISGIVRDTTERRRSEEALLRSQTELRALTRRLQSVREEEHTLMARGIHDELGQALTALRLDLSWLGKKLPEAGAAVQGRIGAMVALTDDTIEAVRRVVAELRPPILDELGLAPALDWYVQSFAKRAGLRYEFDRGPAGLVVDRELAVIAYRIVQEALTNVARHAHAKHVAVRLGEKAGALTVEIRDDGRGISEDAVTSPRSLGIVGMRERALVRGGSLAVMPLPGGGTSVRVTIPSDRRREPRERG